MGVNGISPVDLARSTALALQNVINSNKSLLEFAYFDCRIVELINTCNWCHMVYDCLVMLVIPSRFWGKIEEAQEAALPCFSCRILII